MVYLKTTKWRPLNSAPVSSFIAQGEKAVTKSKTKYPLHSMGSSCLDSRGEELVALTPTPYTKYYAHHSLCTLMYPPPLSLMGMCT